MIRKILVVCYLLVVAVKYSSCHKVKLINPGDLVDLGLIGCADGKWHDFVNGVTFPEGSLVEVTPGNVTEFVCVRGTEMETLVLMMMKQRMTFLSDRGEGRWRSENVTLVCSVEIWTQTLKLFHLSISKSTRRVMDTVTARRDGSLVSMSVNYTFYDDDDDDDDDGVDDDVDDGDEDNDDDLSYSCNWEIQFDESQREILESQNLKVKILEPVNRVRPGSTALATNTTLQCLADGFPAPHFCTCDLRTPPNHTHLSSEGPPLQPGSYLVACLGKNTIRGETYNSTWIGYLDVQSQESRGLRPAKGLDCILIVASSVVFCLFYKH